jgi:hypothetical protein
MTLYTLNQAGNFMLYPSHTMIVLLSTEARVAEVVSSLQAHDINTDDIRVLHGESGRHILDVDGAENGILGKLVRMLENVSEVQRTYVKYVDEQLAAGAYAMSVPVTDESKQDAVAEVFRTAHAHFIVYFRKASIVDIQVPRDVAVL